MAKRDVRFLDFLGKALRPNAPAEVRGMIDDVNLINLANRAFHELNIIFPNRPNLEGSNSPDQVQSLKKYYGELILHNRGPLKFLNNPTLAGNNPQYELSEIFYSGLGGSLGRWINDVSITPNEELISPLPHVPYAKTASEVLKETPTATSASTAVVEKPFVHPTTPTASEVLKETPTATSASTAVVEKPFVHPTTPVETVVTPPPEEISDVERQAEAVAAKRWAETEPTQPINEPENPPRQTPQTAPIRTRQPEEGGNEERLPRESVNQPVEAIPSSSGGISMPNMPSVRAKLGSVGKSIGRATESTEVPIQRFGQRLGQEFGRGIGGFGRVFSGNNPGEGLLNQVPRTLKKVDASAKSLTGKLKTRKKWLLLLWLFMMMLVLGFFDGFSGPGGTVASCKFTKGSTSKTITSTTLQSVFQQVSVVTKVPSSVLASMAMHENQNFTANGTNDDPAFEGKLTEDGTRCKSFSTSSNGALGLMQVLPANKISSKANPKYGEGLKIGAKFAGIDPNNITLQNFCDIRTNVFLAAGVLIAENGGKLPPQTSSDIKSSVCAYIGFPAIKKNCFYFEGPILHDYGQEVSSDADKCPQTLGGVIPPPGGGGGNITQCTFYRDPEAPRKFQNPLWPVIINDVASKVGIPASILAGVLRVESGTEFSTSADSDYLANDFDNHCSRSNACGAMQFKGPTFHEVFTKHQAELSSVFGKSTDDTATNVIQGSPKALDTTVFRIFSIKDSITAAAYKLKDDSGGVWDKSSLDKAISRYFNGTCNYDSNGKTYSYCDNVWKSFQNCSSTTPPPPVTSAVSCPVPGGKIITPSFSADPVGGHCSSGYLKQYTCNECSGNRNASRRANAIDIETKGADVVLPTIQGQTVQWTMLPPICAGAGTYPSCTNSNGGTGALLNFKAPLPGTSDTWYIQFVHMAIGQIYLSSGSTNPSGTAVGKVDATGHVHTTIGKNISDPNAACNSGWMPSDSMCSGVTPPVVTGGKTIVLNPGHAVGLSGSFSGAPGEPARNVALAKKIKEKLTVKGFNAFLTHDETSTLDPTNYYNDLQLRIDYSNTKKADLFIEIHFDAGSAGPSSLSDDRRLLSDDGVSTRPNPNIITPNVDAWVANSLKLNKAITKNLALKLNQKYGTTYAAPGNDIQDHRGCLARACGGHLFTIGPQGTRSNPEKPESLIIRENQAVSAFIETLGNTNPYVDDLDTLADGYVDGIVEYFK